MYITWTEDERRIIGEEVVAILEELGYDAWSLSPAEQPEGRTGTEWSIESNDASDELVREIYEDVIRDVYSRRRGH